MPYQQNNDNETTTIDLDVNNASMNNRGQQEVTNHCYHLGLNNLMESH